MPPTVQCMVILAPTPGDAFALSVHVQATIGNKRGLVLMMDDDPIQANDLYLGTVHIDTVTQVGNVVTVKTVASPYAWVGTGYKAAFAVVTLDGDANTIGVQLFSTADPNTPIYDAKPSSPTYGNLTIAPAATPAT
jgi:hypothetical protein